MKLLHILKSKKGMAAELVAISLMFVFTVLSVSALLTANSVLRGVQSDYSEEQAKIYAITLSQAISDQLTQYDNATVNPDDSEGKAYPDVFTQYNNDATGGSVSDNLSSYLYDKYFIQKDGNDIDVRYVSGSSSPTKSDCIFNIKIKMDSSEGWNNLKIDITTKATYKKATYSVVKTYTVAPITEGDDLIYPEVPCKWQEV